MTEYEAVAARLEARAGELAQRATDFLALSPAWTERYGEWGWWLVQEDARAHVAALVEALRAGTSEPLEHHARRLQGALSARGLSSRHLARHLATLGAAIAEAGLDGGAVALAYLERGAQALRYDDDRAGAIQDAVARLADRGVQTLAAEHRDWPLWREVTAPDELREELAILLAHLADAIAVGRADGFAEHIRDVEVHHRRHARPAGALEEMLEALTHAMSEMPNASRAAAMPILVGARAALRAGDASGAERSAAPEWRLMS